MTTLNSQQLSLLAAVDATLDDIFVEGIPGVVTGIQGYSTLTTEQKTKVRNIFDAVVAGMLAAGAAPSGYTGVVSTGSGTLTFTNGILTGV